MPNVDRALADIRPQALFYPPARSQVAARWGGHVNQQQHGRAQEEGKGIDCNDERSAIAHPCDWYSRTNLPREDRRKRDYKCRKCRRDDS